MSRKISDWLLERYALGELPPPLRDSVATALLADEEARSRLAAIQDSNERILTDHPWEAIAGKINRAEDAPSLLQRWSPGPLVAAASAFVIVAASAVWTFVQPPFSTPDTRSVDTRSMAASTDYGIRTKGLLPSLQVHRSRAQDVERLESGAMAREGEVIQLSYNAAGKRYGMIVSVDGAGVLTFHLPQQGGSSGALEPQGAVPLGHAYELDGAPAFERFYFLAADAPFSVDEILTAVRAGARGEGGAPESLRLPEGIDQATFLLRKP